MMPVFVILLPQPECVRTIKLDDGCTVQLDANGCVLDIVQPLSVRLEKFAEASSSAAQREAA